MDQNEDLRHQKNMLQLIIQDDIPLRARLLS